MTAEEQVEARIREIVDQAPPLTPEQTERLRTLLGPLSG